MKNQRKNPIIILATYWNERYFIEPSLKQIDALNPCEIIIADGCFNPRVPNYSTDGTREIIEEFVAKRPHARMVSAQRPGFFRSIWMLLRGHRHLPWWTMFRPARWKFLFVSLLRTSYQRNEGLTLQHMISMSREWEPGIWFMTYDADQFYSDEMIGKIKELVNKKDASFGLITAAELTFFKDFDNCTSGFEKRIFSNMPHRIYPDTLIQPQRSMIRETKSGKSSFFKFRDILAKHLYFRHEKTVDGGIYFHYKISPAERYEAGYLVGKRKKPSPDCYLIEKFIGRHPRIIRDYFNI